MERPGTLMTPWGHRISIDCLSLRLLHMREKTHNLYKLVLFPIYVTNSQMQFIFAFLCMF